MKNMYAVKCIYKSTLYKLDDNSEIKHVLVEDILKEL